jgi:hypothetical protein
LIAKGLTFLRTTKSPQEYDTTELASLSGLTEEPKALERNAGRVHPRGNGKYAEAAENGRDIDAT